MLSKIAHFSKNLLSLKDNKYYEKSQSTIKKRGDKAVALDTNGSYPNYWFFSILLLFF